MGALTGVLMYLQDIESDVGERRHNIDVERDL